MQKCGSVALLGRPNAGKSSLINAMVGQKIVGVSTKPHTTRNAILGIAMADEAQLLIVDTPGLSQGPRRTLTTVMMRQAWEALDGADVVCYLIDCARPIHDEDEAFFGQLLARAPERLLLVATKIDKVAKPLLMERALALDTFMKKAAAAHGVPQATCPIHWVSAKRKEDVAHFKAVLAKRMPEGAWQYDPDNLTDRPERFVLQELIREKVFRQLGAELPYQSAVVVDAVEDKNSLVSIVASIIVSRDSHKGMVLGKKGAKIKEIGQEARAALEKHYGRKVFLELTVLVRENWHEKEASVMEFLDADDT